MFFYLFTSPYIHSDCSSDTIAFLAGGRASRHFLVLESQKVEISRSYIPRDACTNLSLLVLCKRHWEVSNTVASPQKGYLFWRTRTRLLERVICRPCFRWKLDPRHPPVRLKDVCIAAILILFSFFSVGIEKNVWIPILLIPPLLVFCQHVYTFSHSFLAMYKIKCLRSLLCFV